MLYGSLAWAAPTAALAEEEVIVTAERREQAIADEGSSVSVLMRGELQRVGAHHPVEALNRVPGVSYHRGSGVENLPAIRSPVLNGGAGAGSFLVLEDGVPVRAAPFANINQIYETNLEFAERLEVIRGPGTVVHGSNAVHGVVNVITPGAEERSLQLEAEAGSFGRARASLLSQAHGWVGAFAATNEDGWRDNAGLDLQKLLLGWQGAAGGWDMRLRASASNLEQETAGFVIGADAYDNGDLARANLNPEAFRDSQIVRAALTASRRVGDLEMTLTPFARHIETDLLLHFFPSKALEETVQSGAGVQSSFAWDLPAWRFLAGVDLDRSTMSLTETQSIPTVGTFPQGVHYDYDVSAFTRAAYAQATWRPNEDWSLTFGARGERIDYEYDNQASDGGFGRFLRAPDREDSFSVRTARMNVVRHFDGGAVAYANYTTGARPPQATDLYSLQITQTPGEQDVEDIASAEVGVRLPVGDAYVGLVIYDMHKRHGSFRNANGLTVTDTRTQHRGIELEFDAPLLTGLSLSGWVSYADHTYDFDSPADDIANGARIESAPEWTTSLQLLWRPSTTAELELGWHHVGDYITEASGEHAYQGHDILSLRGAWDVTANAELFASVRNLTNTDYAERADFAFGNDRYFPGEDRAFSLGVRIIR
ncbi:MAG TPA: TonB-dependent receptor [Candidatus Binatia bacterium]|nr:TonB-dependent receptor [Candidatus Binatia bacterium]